MHTKESITCKKKGLSYIIPCDTQKKTKHNTNRVLRTEEPTASKILTVVSPLKKFSNATNIISLVFFSLWLEKG
jgi:hypothetical protein